MARLPCKVLQVYIGLMHFNGATIQHCSLNSAIALEISFIKFLRSPNKKFSTIFQIITIYIQRSNLDLNFPIFRQTTSETTHVTKILWSYGPYLVTLSQGQFPCRPSAHHILVDLQIPPYGIYIFIRIWWANRLHKN